MSEYNRSASFRIWLEEDLGSGDHTTLATIGSDVKGRAVLLAKSSGVLAGVQAALDFFSFVDDSLTKEVYLKDGARISAGDRVFELKGSARALLIGERVALNLMQRMSGIATLTDRFVQALSGTQTVLLDTRKTTPGFRWSEKEAVRIGGGSNHRFGLYDRILIKDNHIDHGGGIRPVLDATRTYMSDRSLKIPVEIEVRNLTELQTVIDFGQGLVDRVMLDNFSPAQVREAVGVIGSLFETEVSGGVQLDNVRAYGEAGVDFISVGALTHQAVSLDLSLKTVIE
jgi:nicotinate-nucleotide pyrophosphorylase (carboxylating)